MNIDIKCYFALKIDHLHIGLDQFPRKCAKVIMKGHQNLNQNDDKWSKFSLYDRIAKNCAVA